MKALARGDEEGTTFSLAADAQHILKAVKTIGANGAFRVTRSDIFGGAVIPFVPLPGGHQS